MAAFALVGNGSGYVGGGAGGFNQITIPSSTPFKILFKFRLASTIVEQPIVGTTTGTNSNFIIMSGTSKTLILRLNESSTSLASGVLSADTDYDCEIIRTGTSSLEMKLNGASVATGTSSQSFAFNNFMRRGSAYLSAGSRLYNFKVEVSGSTTAEFVNEVDNTQTTWDNKNDPTTNAILLSLATDGSQWFEYTPASEGVSFSGPIPDQELVEGETTISLSGYFTAAISYSSVGTALPVWATLNTTTGQITGDSTGFVALTSGVVIRGSDGSGTADSNAFNINVSAASALIPQGTVTITLVTVSTSTANVTYTYSDTDEDSFEYRIDGGTPQPSLSNPETIPALSSGVAHTVEYRAVNAYGPGSWSDTEEFTLATDISITTGVIKNETLTVLSDTVFTTVDVYSDTTGEQVVRFTDVTSSPTGVLMVTDNANFVSGTTYLLLYKLANGDWGTEKVVAV